MVVLSKFLALYVQDNSELSLIWALGQRMWQRDLPATYDALRKDWSDNVKPVMAAIQGTLSVCHHRLLVYEW